MYLFIYLFIGFSGAFPEARQRTFAEATVSSSAISRRFSRPHPHTSIAGWALRPPPSPGHAEGPQCAVRPQGGAAVRRRRARGARRGRRREGTRWQSRRRARGERIAAGGTSRCECPSVVIFPFISVSFSCLAALRSGEKHRVGRSRYFGRAA